MEVSDLDSDLELDELIPTYLKIKGRLYEIDPSLAETTARKQPKSTKSRKTVANQAMQTPAVRKLTSQLQRIASDALFDEREAETQWPAKRNQIAQDKATRRQDQESHPVASDQQTVAAVAVESAAAKLDPLDSGIDLDGSGDEADLLGGMFSAVPDEPAPVQSGSDDTVTENVTLRDFGKSSGLTPRRLLEETVRSRFVRHDPVAFLPIPNLF